MEFGTKLKHTVEYFRGSECNCTVDDLAPSSLYLFRLKVFEAGREAASKWSETVSGLTRGMQLFPYHQMKMNRIHISLVRRRAAVRRHAAQGHRVRQSPGGAKNSANHVSRKLNKYKRVKKLSFSVRSQPAAVFPTLD